MAGRLDGKVALISGGARGQGAEEGRLFRSEGATVYLTDVLDDEGTALAGEIGATYLHHDVTSEAEWAAVVESVVATAGHLDVLVNNAGIFRVVPLTQTSLDLYNQVMDVNATGVFLGMKTVAPQMIRQRSGSIVNISSIAGLRGAGMAFAYGASKWAVRGMTKAASGELAPHGVRVNSVHPGIIDTQMITEIGPNWRDVTLPRIPNGRVATALDVAKLVLYLASDESAYSTGSEFVVDGGMTA